MHAVDLLSEVEALIACLESGRDPILTCERILGILDEDPTVESASLPSVRTGEQETVDFGATWSAEPSDETFVPDALGATRGTWAPEAAPKPSEPRSAGLRGVCEGLIDGTLPGAEALDVLAAWRDVRRPAARYVLGRPLGRGGMGEVIAARDVALDRELALKVLLRGSPAARSAFVAEAKLTARLDHPGVVPVHDVGETPDGRPYFAMKRVEGRSLREVLEQGGLKGLRPRLDLFRRVCETVAFAHDRGVLHLDLKPDNLMIGAFGEVLVMDWGLAREVTEGSATLKHVAGTPRYMAPEQATRGAKLDVRTDVYSLGAILYELLTDLPAFPGTDHTTVLDEVREGRFVRPLGVAKGVPRELDALVVAAMATDPRVRLPTVLTLLAEVEAFLEDRPLATVAYSPWQRLVTWSRRHRASVQGAALAGVLGAVALVGASGLYAAQVTEAWREADEQRMVAEASARAAQEQFARSQYTTGTVLMREHRYLQAGEAFEQALLVQQELGLDERSARLALAELAWRQQPVEQVAIDGRPSSMVLVDGVLSGARGGGPSFELDVDTLELRELPHERQPIEVGGHRWWLERRPEAVAVWGPDGELRHTLSGAWMAEHGVLYSLDEPRWLDLAQGVWGSGVFAGCDEPRTVVGHFYSCHGGNSPFSNTFFHRQTGEQLLGYASQASGDADAYWNPSQVQPLVIDDQGRLRWTTDEGAASFPTSVSGGRAVGWLVSDGRVIVRDWVSSQLLIAFQRPVGACEGPVGYDASRQLAVIACSERVEVMRQGAVPRRASYLHALALSPMGEVMAWMTEDGLVVEGRGERRVLPTPHRYRDLDFGPGGTLAGVAKEAGVVDLFGPDGSHSAVDLDGQGLGVAWGPGGVLAVIDEAGVLHELDGEVHRKTVLPDFARKGWGVAPLGDGWAVSDYRGEGRRALWVRRGEVVSELEVAGARQPSFDIAANADATAVVIGTSDGAWVWDGGSEPLHLPGTLSVGVTWAPSGPVVASVDNVLRFYDAQGGVLHGWSTPAIATTLAYGGGYLGMLAADTDLMDGGYAVRAALGLDDEPVGTDPMVALWFPAP